MPFGETLESGPLNLRPYREDSGKYMAQINRRTFGLQLPQEKREFHEDIQFRMMALTALS